MSGRETYNNRYSVTFFKQDENNFVVFVQKKSNKQKAWNDSSVKIKTVESKNFKNDLDAHATFDEYKQYYNIDNMELIS